MSALTPFIEVKNLDDLQLGQMWFVLNSPAYADAFEPHLTKMRNMLNERLLDRSTERKNEYPDDYLAGYICAIDELLAFFRNITEETRTEQITRALSPELTPDEQYSDMQKRGLTRPAGQTEQYQPEEDY